MVEEFDNLKLKQLLSRAQKSCVFQENIRRESSWTNFRFRVKKQQKIADDLLTLEHVLGGIMIF